MIKNILRFKTLLLFGLVCVPFLSFAVTQKEMEQARTIAAKAYIRYANDGSGYLDDLNPTTMEELEASLKPKEKENIKAFKAIPVPTDYKDWNKDKLLEYWAVTAFQNKGLLEKGRGGRIRARSQINKMTISVPSVEAPVATAASTEVQTQSATPSDTGNNANVALNELKIEEQAALDAEENEDYNDLNIDKATNYTWVYIMVLAILVAIVIALVVYAANVLKKNGQQPAEQRSSHEDDSDLREHYETMISDKDVEISMLKKKLESAGRQNSELKSRLEMLTAEISNLKLSQNSATREPQRSVSSMEAEPQRPALRTIYLGRANIRGIFVRADRTLNIGNSIFVLDTSDGFSGTFRVADSPAAWSLALSNPKEYLETACTGRDLNDTANVSKIVTESAGTAVFEGGCWRVIRKAKIHYEF